MIDDTYIQLLYGPFRATKEYFDSLPDRVVFSAVRSDRLVDNKTFEKDAELIHIYRGTLVFLTKDGNPTGDHYKNIILEYLKEYHTCEQNR